ncbi:MAG: hypothetical protein AB7P20_28235 [Rhizobiaceae bacterium]
MAQHVRTTIRYDGPALGGHEMDVRDLAPALLALADIVQFANKKFNGDAAEMRVLVNADVEQKCFMLDLSVVQSLLEQARGFFGSDGVKTAKEIAEWIGLIGGGSIGLFQFMKLIRRRGEAGTKFEVDQQNGSTTVTITGDGNTIVVPVQTYQLAQEKYVVDRAKEVLKPLEKAGIDSLAFVEGETPVFKVDDAEAGEILATPAGELDPLPHESVSNIRGAVRIKSPQYEGVAKWSLLWNGRAIDAEMADEAAAWVTDFQENRVAAPPNTVLDVSMTETVKLDDQGLAVGKPTYVVSKVHGVTPPPQQTSIFDGK